jgi:hypothetical protein
MLAALDEFQAPAAVTDALEVPTAQAEDEVVTLLRQKAVRVQRSRDALFVAVHAMILEAGTARGRLKRGRVYPARLPRWLAAR